MSQLLPLPAAIPLLAAALVVATDHVLPRRVKDAIALAATGSAAVVALVVLAQTERHGTVHWFGGWTPRHGVALGVAFVAEPLGAGMAALALILATLSLAYSWTSMREAARLYDTLILLFAGAMAGFALSGDLFNMFVWFELMGVAAYALCGFKVAELGPLQGGISFAITNTLGAYFIVTGIALLYARTGALNLAQIGETLAGQRMDGLALVAFLLLLVGFSVKAAIVPFHFWLADAHAVAPAPVCVLFSGAMVELGLLGIARVYWTAIVPLGHNADVLRGTLVWLGVLTALLGALMAFLQRHIKRLLAYSTIAHAGTMLAGIGVLGAKGLAGAGLLVVAHAFLKGALFLACGILLVAFQDMDELRMHGAARGMRLLWALWIAAAVGLAGTPWLGTFIGHAGVDEGATEAGIEWAQPLLMVAAGVSTGAILRAGARVFRGWGPREDDLLSNEPPEGSREQTAAFPLMLAVTATMVVLGLGTSLVPGLAQRAEQGAERFRDRSAYVDLVLHGHTQAEPRPPVALPHVSGASLAYSTAALLLALATAAFGLWRDRLPGGVRRVGWRIADPLLNPLRAAHSGIVGDYLLWIVAGTAAVGAVWAAALR
jgi:multicomponent Na+:H+ antiporter subunit D